LARIKRTPKWWVSKDGKSYFASELNDMNKTRWRKPLKLDLKNAPATANPTARLP